MPKNLRINSSNFIDETTRVSFKFDGKTYYGFKGDTLASALIANGIHLVARSFKYHRPRGIMTAGSEEPNAIVQINGNTAYTEPLGGPSNPATSANAIKAARPSVGDGIYWIATNFNGNLPFWCDMTTDGGGWILVYKSGNWPNQGCSNGNYFEFPRNAASGGNEAPMSVLGDAEWTGMIIDIMVYLHQIEGL